MNILEHIFNCYMVGASLSAVKNRIEYIFVQNLRQDPDALGCIFGPGHSRRVALRAVHVPFLCFYLLSLFINLK